MVPFLSTYYLINAHTKPENADIFHRNNKTSNIKKKKTINLLLTAWLMLTFADFLGNNYRFKQLI